MFKQALVAAHRKLDKLKAAGRLNDFALIGAMALSIYAEPRSTADIDFVIYPKSDLKSIAEQLGGVWNTGDIYDPLAGAVSFSVGRGNRSVSIQCVQFHPAIEAICFEGVKETKLDRFKLRTVSPTALVLLKLYGGSALDLEDARKVLSAGAIKGEALETLRKKAQALRLSARLKAITSHGA